MNFTHDFAADLAALDFNSPDPWALVRFADGERAILEGRDIPTADGWKVPPVDSEFTRGLWESLHFRDEGYHVGISCVCCDPQSAEWYRARVGVPESRCTYSNLFANGNAEVAYQRLLDTAQSHMAVLIFPNCDCVGNMPRIDDMLSQLKHLDLRKRECFFVAAGPASNIIIHRYWRDTPPEKRRTIVDIGSALDPLLHNKITRGYHHPDHPNRQKVCVWS